jgi:hypothetical protein
VGFDIALEDKEGDAVARLDDPRGHFDLVLFVAEERSSPSLSTIDDYSDHVFTGESAANLVTELSEIRGSLSADVLDEIKLRLRERRSRIPISPRGNEGYREYLDLGDLVRVRLLLDEVIALAQRAAADSRLRLVWYGD